MGFLILKEVDQQAQAYTEAYKMADDFVPFCLGAAMYVPTISTASIGEFLDQCRKDFTTMTETLWEDEGVISS